jgi:hypothetical protein
MRLVATMARQDVRRAGCAFVSLTWKLTWLVLKSYQMTRPA